MQGILTGRRGPILLSSRAAEKLKGWNDEASGAASARRGSERLLPRRAYAAPLALRSLTLPARHYGRAWKSGRLVEAQASSTRLSILTRALSGWTPTVRSSGLSLPLKIMTCGIEEMP